MQAIIFGGFPIPSISPKNKLESPTQHLETSEGQPFEATKSTLQDDIQDLHHGGKSCQQRVSEGIYFLSWHLCLLIQRIFFFDKKASHLIDISRSGPGYKSFFINLNSLPFFARWRYFSGWGGCFLSILPFIRSPPFIHQPIISSDKGGGSTTSRPPAMGLGTWMANTNQLA